MMSNLPTLLLGASPHEYRYSYKAVKMLHHHGHQVFAIGAKEAHIGTTPIVSERIYGERIDTITLYLNPERQKPYYDYIIALQPRRIIFNPGTENSELAKLAEAANIIVEEACTLVLLQTGQY